MSFILPFPSTLLTPSPSNSKKIFQPGLGGLSSSGVFYGRQYKYNFPCKIAKTKGKSQIFKKISDGFRCFEFEGGNKVDENGILFTVCLVFLASLMKNSLLQESRSNKRKSRIDLFTQFMFEKYKSISYIHFNKAFWKKNLISSK